METQNTTLVCVMTDATLDKPGPRADRDDGERGRGAGGRSRLFGRRRRRRLLPGLGRRRDRRFTSIQVGTLAATLTAAAIRPSSQHRVRSRASRHPRTFMVLSELGVIFPALMPGSFKTEAVVLRSIRYGEADRHPAPLQRHARADQRDRQGGAAPALALRRAAGAVLPARSGAPRGPRRAVDGDGGAHGRRHIPICARTGLRSRLRRGAATRCCGCATRRRRTRPRTTCCAATWRCSTARSRRAGVAVPLVDGAAGLGTALAFRLKLALATGFAPSSPPAPAAARPRGSRASPGRPAG